MCSRDRGRKDVINSGLGRLQPCALFGDGAGAAIIMTKAMVPTSWASVREQTDRIRPFHQPAEVPTAASITSIENRSISQMNGKKFSSLPSG